MTDEQFNGLPEQLQIWALRENAVIYVGFGVLPSLTSTVFVKIPLEKSNYPNIIHKNRLKTYSSCEIVTLVNYRQ